MDDDFAKDVSEFDTLEELKADLEKKIGEERQKEIDREFEDELMNQVADGITAEIPDAMVEGQARQYLENFKSQVAQQGIPYDQYLQLTGMSEAKILEDAREPALKQVRMDLAVAAIIKAENIEASDEDVEAEYKRMADQFGMDVEMVKKYLLTDTIRDQVRSLRAVKVVVENAIATKPEEKPAEETGEEPAEKSKRTRKKKTEDAPADAETAEKPKRTRKKKTDEAEKPDDENPAE